MKVSFCHDGPLIKKNSHFYSISHNNDSLSRYYHLAEILEVIIRVKSVSLDFKVDNLSEITLNPFIVTNINNISTLRGQLFNKYIAAKKIKESFNSSDFVIIRLPSLIGLLSLDIAKKLNKPYIIELVGCPWDTMINHSLYGRLIAVFLYILTRSAVSNSKFVIYVTSKFLQQRYPTKGYHIDCSNIVLTEFDDNVILNRTNRINNRNKSDKIILGSIGSVNVKYKGHRHIINAIKKLKDKGFNNFEYHIVGAGDQKSLIKLTKKNNLLNSIKFIGPIRHEDISDFLDHIDIYCQPSDTEGLPRALIEAMSRGCPSIGSNAGGIPELLLPRFVFRKGNVSEICSILLSFDKDLMLETSLYNFNVSKTFDSGLIKIKRNQIFEKFKLHVLSQKKHT